MADESRALSTNSAYYNFTNEQLETTTGRLSPYAAVFQPNGSYGTQVLDLEEVTQVVPQCQASAPRPMDPNLENNNERESVSEQSRYNGSHRVQTHMHPMWPILGNLIGSEGMEPTWHEQPPCTEVAVQPRNQVPSVAARECGQNVEQECVIEQAPETLSYLEFMPDGQHQMTSIQYQVEPDLQQESVPGPVVVLVPNDYWSDMERQGAAPQPQLVLPAREYWQDVQQQQQQQALRQSVLLDLNLEQQDAVVHPQKHTEIELQDIGFEAQMESTTQEDWCEREQPTDAITRQPDTTQPTVNWLPLNEWPELRHTIKRKPLANTIPSRTECCPEVQQNSDVAAPTKSGKSIPDKRPKLWPKKAGNPNMTQPTEWPKLKQRVAQKSPAPTVLSHNDWYRQFEQKAKSLPQSECFPEVQPTIIAVAPPNPEKCMQVSASVHQVQPTTGGVMHHQSCPRIEQTPCVLSQPEMQRVVPRPAKRCAKSAEVSPLPSAHTVPAYHQLSPDNKDEVLASSFAETRKQKQGAASRREWWQADVFIPQQRRTPRSPYPRVDWTPYSYGSISTLPEATSNMTPSMDDRKEEVLDFVAPIMPTPMSSSNMSSEGTEAEFPSFEDFVKQVADCGLSSSEYLGTLRNLLLRAHNLMLPLLCGRFAKMSQAQMAAYTTAILEVTPLHPSLFLPSNVSSSHPQSLTPQDLVRMHVSVYGGSGLSALPPNPQPEPPPPLLIDVGTQTDYECWCFCRPMGPNLPQSTYFCTSSTASSQPSEQSEQSECWEQSAESLEQHIQLQQDRQEHPSSLSSSQEWSFATQHTDEQIYGSQLSLFSSYPYTNHSSWVNSCSNNNSNINEQSDLNPDSEYEHDQNIDYESMSQFTQNCENGNGDSPIGIRKRSTFLTPTGLVMPSMPNIYFPQSSRSLFIFNMNDDDNPNTHYAELLPNINIGLNMLSFLERKRKSYLMRNVRTKSTGMTGNVSQMMPEMDSTNSDVSPHSSSHANPTYLFTPNNLHKSMNSNDSSLDGHQMMTPNVDMTNNNLDHINSSSINEANINNDHCKETHTNYDLTDSECESIDKLTSPDET
ncbi:uncharacterized protein LOC6565219 [Drosophila grimshawi]|uniref:uncharacterized protein LOC6565219 n=1 Tax=Drosophila grimshawi TaxID=7222 RepID=UPI001C933242|nr:uncharacterized protein LOC6565219 [Drosophila grimshawi]